MTTEYNPHSNLTLLDGHTSIWLVSRAFHWGRNCRSAISGPASIKPVGKYRIQKSGVGKETV